MMQTRVFLTDDHSLLLEAFRTLLEPHYDVVGTATDGREMLSKVKKLEPDVVVLDISMPNLNGFDAGEKLKKILPDVKLVFLTQNEEPETVSEAFRIGANGYLLKKSAASELFETIETVVSNGSYVSSEIAAQMNKSFEKRPGSEKLHGTLTVRQREVLQLLAEGNTMKQVAAILNITARTVAFHKYQIMDNLNLKTNSELVQYAIKRGIVS